MIIEDNLFDICLESVTSDYVSEGFKDVLKKAGTIASDAAKNAGNVIINIINVIINTIRKCVNAVSNKFRKFRGLENKKFEKKDIIKYKFKTSTFKKKSEETSNHKDDEDVHSRISKHEKNIDDVKKTGERREEYEETQKRKTLNELKEENRRKEEEIRQRADNFNRQMKEESAKEEDKRKRDLKQFHDDVNNVKKLDTSPYDHYDTRSKNNTDSDNTNGPLMTKFIQTFRKYDLKDLMGLADAVDNVYVAANKLYRKITKNEDIPITDNKIYLYRLPDVDPKSYMSNFNYLVKTDSRGKTSFEDDFDRLNNSIALFKKIDFSNLDESVNHTVQSELTKMNQFVAKVTSDVSRESDKYLRVQSETI